MKKIFFPVLMLIFMFMNNSVSACDKCGKGDPAVKLHTDLQKLWSEHTQWTYATVDAFYHNQQAFKPELDRLLANQQQLGAAIVPFYGQAAGDKLTALLTEHITLSVPVLTAAKNKDDKALKNAVDDWNRNADQVADFLSAANAQNWKQSDMRKMMRSHIEQTIAYSLALLNNDFEAAVKKYDQAADHMREMSEELAVGIIRQFPAKFTKDKAKK